MSLPLVVHLVYEAVPIGAIWHVITAGGASSFLLSYCLVFECYVQTKLVAGEEVRHGHINCFIREYSVSVGLLSCA